MNIVPDSRWKPAMRHDRRARLRHAWSPLAHAVVLALLTAACATPGTAERATGDTLAITATTTVMGDVVRNVAPDATDVTVLMEPGTDPHTFEPSARQLAELREADLIVASGGGLEAGLEQALDDAATAGAPVFEAIEHVTPLDGPSDPGGGGEEDHGDGGDPGDASGGGADGADGHADDHADDHGVVDPHFWMDPVRTAEAVEALGERIGELTSAPRRSAERARRYSGELRALDRRIAVLLDGVPPQRRTIVTNHQALAYFADRYDLRVVGTVIPGVSTGAEPSARDIEQLAETLRREDVTTIFTDSTAPTQLAATLAREVGPDTAVVELYTEALGGDGPTSYIDMLMTDAERISEALRP